MLGEDARLEHDGVEREHARMIGDDQGRPAVRDVGQPAGLYAEPVPVQRQRRGHQHRRIQIGIEAELVDLVIACQPPPGELGGAREPTAPGG